MQVPTMKRMCRYAGGCVEYATSKKGFCDRHQELDQRREQERVTPYHTPGHHRFRYLVLQRDPVCVICRQSASTRADHYPLGRRQLLDRGLDPDDPQYGRGLCASCDSHQTAQRQPGGWNQNR